MKSKLLSLLCLAMSFSVSAQTVVDVIVNSEDHNTLEAAVIAAELDDDLSTATSVTVFAPTDAAFENLDDGIVEALLADPTGRLADILLYHVIGAEVPSTALEDGQMAMTLQGQEVTVGIDGMNIMINGAMVTVEDIPASNGVVHVIDAVLLPTYPASFLDVIIASEVHNTLEAAVIAATDGLEETFLATPPPFTVFAPTDAAFEDLPEGLVDELLLDPNGRLADILLYHIVGGEASSGGLMDGQQFTTLQGQDVTVGIVDGVVTINGAEVIVDNIYTNDGVVHVIDAVILPTYPATVFDVVVNSEVHETLEAAVIAAGLADDLSGEGSFTLFAPTDEAFGNLPMGLVDELLLDPTGRLADILLYHAVGA
ncbi:MAG: fasciclin domain-containing protein, partial [Bacteroidota bacterium]